MKNTVTYDPERIKTLDRHFLDLVQSGALQGASYLLAQKGKVIACKAMGSLDFEKGGKYTPDSIRRIASMTKMFTAVSVMQLYEQGRIDIFSPVANHLKEFDTDMHRKILPYHLLTHTSGLRADGGYFTEPYMQAWSYKLNNWIEAYLAGPVQSQPDEAWSYSTMGYCVLAELVSRISGLDITEYVDKNIIKPLGMKDTAYCVPEEKLDRLCICTKWERERIKTSVETERNGTPPPGGFGMYSTINDLYRFGQCLLNNGTLDDVSILSRKAVQFISKNQLKNVPAFRWGGQFNSWNFGVGFGVKKDDFSGWTTFGHEGAGFCGMYMDKETELLYIFTVPSGNGWTAETVDCPRAIVWSGIRGNE